MRHCPQTTASRTFGARFLSTLHKIGEKPAHFGGRHQNARQKLDVIGQEYVATCKAAVGVWGMGSAPIESSTKPENY